MITTGFYFSSVSNNLILIISISMKEICWIDKFGYICTDATPGVINAQLRIMKKSNNCKSPHCVNKYSCSIIGMKNN